MHGNMMKELSVPLCSPNIHFCIAIARNRCVLVLLRLLGKLQKVSCRFCSIRPQNVLLTWPAITLFVGRRFRNSRIWISGHHSQLVRIWNCSSSSLWLDNKCDLIMNVHCNSLCPFCFTICRWCTVWWNLQHNQAHIYIHICVFWSSEI